MNSNFYLTFTPPTPNSSPKEANNPLPSSSTNNNLTLSLPNLPAFSPFPNSLQSTTTGKVVRTRPRSGAISLTKPNRLMSKSLTSPIASSGSLNMKDIQKELEELEKLEKKLSTTSDVTMKE